MSEAWRSLLINERIWELAPLESDTRQAIIAAGLSDLPHFSPDLQRALIDQAGNLLAWGEYSDAEDACTRAEIALIERRRQARQAGIVLSNHNTTILTDEERRVMAEHIHRCWL